jgi:hypothetical protein
VLWVWTLRSQSCEGHCLVSDLARVLAGIRLGDETASSDALAAASPCSPPGSRNGRELIRERTEDGRKRAMARAVKFGRKLKLSSRSRASSDRLLAFSGPVFRDE